MQDYYQNELEDQLCRENISEIIRKSEQKLK